MSKIVLGLSATLLLTGGLHAQTFTTGPCHGSDSEGSGGWFSSHRARACELRRTTLPLVNGQLDVSGKNGGIDVVGEDRKDIALEAEVVAQGSSHDEAEDILRKIQIQTAGKIEATGPETPSWGHGSWSVSYHLHVPRQVAARLHTQNGGIAISNVDGAIQAQTTNGGLALHSLAGDVHAETVNGGVDVSLDGDHWRGAGLFANSTNGGVSVKAPANYSAHLVAETVNGGISVGFPVTVQGKLQKHIDTTIGQGGPTIKFQTVNGGFSLDHD